MKLRSALIAALTCSFLLAACTGESSTDEADQAAPLRPTLIDVSSPTSVVDGASPTDIALSASQAFFSQAPVVVVADAADAAAQEQAATLAGDVGAPLLLAASPASEPAPSATAGPAASTPAPESSSVADGVVSRVVGEIERLGATTVVTYGPGAVDVTEALGDGVSSIAASAGAAPSDMELPATEPATPTASVLALATPASGVAAEATARAAGAEVRRVPGPDPRADRELIQALASSKPERVVALGSEFGPADQLAARISVAATGVELPGGGQVLYPYHRHVALYGNPTTGALGSLGEQPLPEAITRVKQLAAQYQQLTHATVVPTFEIITTVASAVPDDDGNYSTESALSDIRPYIDAAAQAGVYVVLDLQPGRTDFLTQAQLYEEFLKQPHVGLALDPEWRLGPNQVHLRQIGTVTAAEINNVATWLADLTRSNNLPQKLLLLHQFKSTMISDRPTVDTSRDELAVLIHVDGFGPPGAKFATWNVLRDDPPPNVWWGWKNFIDEDSPTFTPAQTLAINPVPHFVSYQ
jgi:hypothetical protein